MKPIVRRAGDAYWVCLLGFVILHKGSLADCDFAAAAWEALQ